MLQNLQYKMQSFQESKFNTIDDLEVKGKRVLLRVDLNVPMRHGKISDLTRIEKVLPTIRELAGKGAIVVLLSHFDRPKGKFEPTMSLAPVADALGEVMGGINIRFGVDCIGHSAEEAIAGTMPGEIVLLENLRFHAGEEANDKEFAAALAALGDIYVNDAFSCSHRAHASIVGINEALPCAAGRLMQSELEALQGILSRPEKPVAAIVGGAKVSTKIELLENLASRMDMLLIGGGMANTFLLAKGYSIGKSLAEPDFCDIARKIIKIAEKSGCEILLPQDLTVAQEFVAHAKTNIRALDAVNSNEMILDVGPRSISYFMQKLDNARTILWNGPLGAFETSPFDAGTVMLARLISSLTESGKVKSIAGGGDTVACLGHSGVMDGFTYMSTAGGAFLEWLEGKPLPGVEALTV